MIPSEVKKALDVCIHAGITNDCNGCTYRECENGFCIECLLKDALALIEQLEEDNEKQ